MRRVRKCFAAALSAGLLTLCVPAAPSTAACDEQDPAGPSRSARIRLGPGDLVDAGGTELRSFIETDSIGRVDVAVVSATPRGAVRAVRAMPEVSRFSPHYGEQLKGIAVAVSLGSGRRPASVVLDVRQVCAQYFRNTFLYY